MTRLRCQIANRLWAFACRREANAFQRGLNPRSIAATQEGLLLAMLDSNRTSAFGREHNFAKIRSAREFQRELPLRDYVDFLPAIERIRCGDKNVLTTEPVLRLEVTGGSSGGSKLIPCTASLQHQFQRGIAPWIADLFHHQPGLLDGTCYWSITPAAEHELSDDGAIPVGFEDDCHYAGQLEKWLVRAVQSVPDALKQVNDIELFWYLTLLLLVRDRNLALISIWNPTFLTILDRRLQQWWPQLADDIASGRISSPTPLPPELVKLLHRQLRPDLERAVTVRNSCGTELNRADMYRALWPRLKMISCWRDAAAARPAQELEQLFPAVTIQGKGLLATEGFFTLPLHGVQGCLPAYRSHFFEFLPVENGESCLLHELEAGKSYSLVVTTAGGLYRYRMHDRVEVTGFHRGIPLLRFLGKEAHIVDHCGEKLHEQQVEAVLQQATGNLQARFCTLAYEELEQPAYVLFIEAPAADGALLCQAGEQVDTLLMKNFHYRYCRRLGQLAPIRVFRIEHGGQEDCLHHCMHTGQRLGAVKPLALQRVSGWLSVFHGHLLGESHVTGKDAS